MALPDHLFVGSGDADLYDTRAANWAAKPLRTMYRCTCGKIDNTAQLRATLRAGGYAWPGGYPLYFITSDGGALSFESVRAELAQVLDAIAHRSNNGWRVVGCEINWEDSELMCDHSGKAIPPAYADE